MPEELKCTKLVKIEDPPTPQGKPMFHHEKCGLPASEVEIGGLLTKAKAILCVKHKAMADRESFISTNGFKLGKITKKMKK